MGDDNQVRRNQIGLSRRFIMKVCRMGGINSATTGGILFIGE